ncbi:MAG TPA: hypothetical protein VIA18_33350 [Polyangia bacterium]|nr:hypothetical protein [Polyangia bacterium]
MATDLTCVLVPAGQLEPAAVHAIVRKSGRLAALVRVAPLPKLNLMQIEVHDLRRGMPSEDPELVGAFSKGGRATFVHVNHTAKQAMVHGFIDGKPNEGFAGAPGDDFTARLVAEAGHPLDALTAADDGSRLGIGIAATHTHALMKGRALHVPVGTPTALDSFVFHDRAHQLGDGDRLAWLAFDPALAFGTPGRALATMIEGAPAGAFGPLDGARAEAVPALAALGEQSPAGAKLQDARALELCAFAAGMTFAGGDQLSYWDERVLPLFAICGKPTPPAPVLDAEEADEIDHEETPFLEAMVETLPFAAPPDGEGPFLTQLAPNELGPIAPWVGGDGDGGEHVGALFALLPERLLALVRTLDGKRLTAAMESFAHAWYRALRPGQPEGDAFTTWWQAKNDEGHADLDRFVNDWAELRACLEIASANKLQVALLFYS